jgi:hypothetical protein
MPAPGTTGRGAAESGAFGPEGAPIDADLQAIVDAWPTLPEPVRVGIQAMVRAAQPTRD